MTTVLDLETQRGESRNRVLAGRDLGEAARRELKLGDLDNSDETVEVKVPVDLFSVTSSWFLGAFAPSIRALGPERFLAKYHFSGKSIEEVVKDAIQAVQLTDPLG